jgi:predicted RND superfamily exporter protein
MLKPFFLASLTTIAAFLTLLVAHFRAFMNSGWLHRVVFYSVSLPLSCPACICIMPRGIPHAPTNSFLPKSWDEQKIFKFFKYAAIVGFILGGISLWFAQYVDFENNLRNLRRETTEVAHKKKGIATSVTRTNNRATSTPAAVMGSTPEQLDKLYDTLMIRLHKEKDPTLRSFLTLKTFVPPLDSQKQRLEIIAEIRDLVGYKVFDRAKGNDSVNIATLRKLSQVEKTFTAEDIPRWALDLLREKDGSYGKIGFIYGDFPSWDATALHKFQNDYGKWNFDGENLRTFSSQFILSDVIESVKADSFNLAILITIVIFASLALSLRKPALFVTGILSFGMGIVLTWIAWLPDSFLRVWKNRHLQRDCDSIGFGNRYRLFYSFYYFLDIKQGDHLAAILGYYRTKRDSEFHHYRSGFCGYAFYHSQGLKKYR